VALAAIPPKALAPSLDSRLSDGVLVETSILARVLGLKLLTLEGTVLLSPARLGEVNRGAAAPHRQPPRRIAGAAESDGVGSRLATAEQLLAECGEQLRDLHID
jgi:hypothetical protein